MLAPAGYDAAVARIDVDLFEAAGLNHFEIIETLAQPDAPLARRALAQMGLA